MASTTRESTLAQITKHTKTDAQWRTQLSAEQYRVLREHGTEAAFSGRYTDHDGVGVYRCINSAALTFEPQQ